MIYKRKKETLTEFSLVPLFRNYDESFQEFSVLLLEINNEN
jgi:hypothetical protein